MKSKEYEDGLALLNKLHGGHSGEAILNAFARVCPKMSEMTLEIIFGDLMLRPQLDIKTRELAIIASLTTLGHSLPQVKAHAEAALTAGATKEEIAEVILQTAYFAGFPAAANAMIAIKDLYE
jgi:4-carboxymuconolactone decarboxylase